MITEIRYETPADTIAGIKGKVIFLAGVTVRGNQQHLTSWRFACIEELNRQGFEGTVIIPEFVDKTRHDKDEWIPLWEFEGLKRADVIMFWIPRTRELIGLTSNWELGYWIGRDYTKLVYGRPNEAFRMAYIDIMWRAAIEDQYKQPAPPIHRTMEDTIAAAIRKADGDEFDLEYCPECIQMTNHLHGACQKCKIRKSLKANVANVLTDDLQRDIMLKYVADSKLCGLAEAEKKWEEWIQHQLDNYDIPAWHDFLYRKKN